MGMYWTLQEDIEIEKLVKRGFTYQQIANNLGATRSAVAGRVSRLGVKGPRSDPSKARNFGSRN